MWNQHQMESQIHSSVVFRPEIESYGAHWIYKRVHVVVKTKFPVHTENRIPFVQSSGSWILIKWKHKINSPICNFFRVIWSQVKASVLTWHISEKGGGILYVPWETGTPTFDTLYAPLIAAARVI
jgi:hypothetical protein